MLHGVRLKQICLVAPKLEPVVSHIGAIMGLEVCYRDPNVARYGLENALLPVGPMLLEVIAPTQPGTAAGRFIDRNNGRGGYIAIFECNDPRERQANAEALDVRTAHVIDRPPYLGVQLHPRDCRAAFIELNRTDGSDGEFGAYAPAGPDWAKHVNTDTTRALTGVEFLSPEPDKLAAHWGAIVGFPAKPARDGAELRLPNATLSFSKGEREIMSGLVFEARSAPAIAAAARARKYHVTHNAFNIAGVTFKFGPNAP